MTMSFEGKWTRKRGPLYLIKYNNYWNTTILAVNESRQNENESSFKRYSSTDHRGNRGDPSMRQWHSPSYPTGSRRRNMGGLKQIYNPSVTWDYNFT